MVRSLSLFVGLRYLRAKRRNHFISFITFFSAIGIALGVMILIVVLSVMNGFEKEIFSRSLGMASHASISDFSGKLADWPEVGERAEKHPDVLASAPYVETQAMLANGQNISGAMIRGILPNEEPKVAEKIVEAAGDLLKSLTPGSYHILLGRDLRAKLGLRVGSKVTLITPQASVTPAGILPRLKRFTVIGDFTVGMGEYDGGVAYIHMQDAQKLMRMNDSVTGVRVKLTDMLQAPIVRYELAELFRGLQGSYRFVDWTQQYANFYKALAMEKKMMFIILTLIILVAAFNIVSTLVMVVTDKTTDIAILRTLGMSPGQVMTVFMVQGTVIGLVGTLLGGTLGVLLAVNLESIVSWIEEVFGISFLSPDIYYISSLPSDLHWEDVLQIGIVSFLLSILATLYPAWQASRTQPAEALRYE